MARSSPNQWCLDVLMHPHLSLGVDGEIKHCVEAKNKLVIIICNNAICMNAYVFALISLMLLYYLYDAPNKFKIA